MGRWLALVVMAVAVCAAMIWSTLALYYADVHDGSPRRAWAGLLLAFFAASWIVGRKRRHVTLATALVLFLAVLVWYLTLRPSNQRDWAPDVAVTPTADIRGDLVTIRSVRNFSYRSETDFTPRYEDRTYDLSTLATVDFVASYWGSDAIAHTMISFGFSDGQHLCASIETRKERNESYSAIQGFFRQYELVYVFADERDLIGVRTNHRKEDVYLFKTRITPDRGRLILLDYLKSANRLAAEPAFYNALTDNCTTGLVVHLDAVPPGVPWSVNTLTTGYTAESAYKHGGLDQTVPFADLKRAGHVNPLALAAGESADFSRRIRAGVPGYATAIPATPPATKGGVP